MIAPNVSESVSLAEMNLGMPPTSFYLLLREPNDWSFVLKLHCVFECALAQLVERRGADGTIDHYSTFARKVEAAFQLPFLRGGETWRSFLVNLNFLRNRFAHKAAYMSVDIRTVLLDVPLPRRRAALVGLGLATAFDRPDTLLEAVNKAMGRPAIAGPCSERAREARIWLRGLYARLLMIDIAGLTLDLVSTAYYIAVGNDGASYLEDFRPQLQDLLHDPAVTQLLRQCNIDMQDFGLGGTGAE
jgi:hypothetical protein